MAARANRRTYASHPAIPTPPDTSCPHVTIDVSALPQPYIPPPPTGSSSPAPMSNAYSRTYGALGNKPSAENLLKKIEALKNAKSCPEFIERAKLELDLAKLQSTHEDREFYLIDADLHLQRALSIAQQYTFDETLKLMWLSQITTAHKDLRAYAKEHQIEFSELKLTPQEPPKTPKLPEKKPERHLTITRIAGGIIALLGLVFISGLVIHRFQVKRRIA